MVLLRPGGLQRLSLENRIAAELLPRAVLALETGPDRIELIDGSLNKSWIVCQNTRLEVPGSGTLHADARATSLYTAAQAHLPGHRLRTDYTDGDPDQEADFYLLRHTSCPAVLSENLFMDNLADCAFLLSEEGRQSLVDLHVTGITNYLNTV